VTLPEGPPPSVLYDATLICTNETGAEQLWPLLEAEDLAFTAVRPRRKFPVYQGQRHFSGLWWTATTRAHVGYESWLERYWLTELDHDPEVVGIASQPFTLTWASSKRPGFTKHTPDFVAERLNGTTVVVDCRPVRRITDDTAEKFAATQTVCKMLDWTYLVLTEPTDVSRYVNLRWLAGYRHPRFAQAQIEDSAHQVIDDHERGLYEVAQAIGDPISTLPVLYHLMWRGEIVCSHAYPLVDRTLIRWAQPGEVRGISRKDTVT
jgi:hypothetical protein